MFVIQINKEEGFVQIQKDSFTSTLKDSNATKFHTRAVANKQIHDLSMRNKWPDLKVIKWEK